MKHQAVGPISESRHRGTSMPTFIICVFSGREINIPLPFVRSIFAVEIENKLRKDQGARNKNRHLQYRCDHSRTLSIWMPSSRKKKPTPTMSTKMSHRCFSGSKSWYRGANTRTRVPASRNASPPISAGLFLGCKVTSVLGEATSFTAVVYAAIKLLYSKFSDRISLSMVSLNRYGFLRLLNRQVISSR